MKIKIIALTSLLLLCVSLCAQQAPSKIGVINIQKALASTQEGQKASQDLAAKVAPKQKEFNARQQEIAQLEEQLSKGANLLNDEKKAQMARDLDLKKKRLERDTQDAEETIRTEQQTILQNLGQRLMAVSNQIREGQRLLARPGGRGPEHADSLLREWARYHAGHHRPLRQNLCGRRQDRAALSGKSAPLILLNHRFRTGVFACRAHYVYISSNVAEGGFQPARGL